MTYFSDFDYDDHYFDDETMRKRILRDAEDMYLEDSFESVPDDLIEALEEVY